MATHPIAQGIAQLGRGNDSMLMHVTPNEVAGLQAIAKSMGGEITVNPHTGLPEAGFFDFVGSLLPMAAGMAFAPATGGASLGLTGLSATAAPIIAGAATGAILANAKGEDPLMGGLMGGMGGYGGGGLGDTFAKMGSAAAPTATTATSATAGNTLPTAAQVAENPAGFQAAANLNSGLNATTPANAFETSMGLPQTANIGSNAVPQAGVATQAPPPTFGQGLSNIGQGMQRLGSEGGWDAFKTALGPDTTNTQAAMKLGTPLAMAGLSAIEPTKPYEFTEDKYDPYATLNLNKNTGLRFPRMAAGGPIAFADGGGIDNMEEGIRSSTPAGFNSMAEAMRLHVPAGFNSMAEAMRLYVPAGFNSMEEGLNRRTTNLAGGGIAELQNTYNQSDNQTPPQLSQDGYGLGRLNALAESGLGYAKGGYLDGPGDGMSDSIPATIEGKQPARLADGEFVIPADVVSHLGNGSTKAGSQRLYGMLDKVRKARTGTKKQGKQINPNKYMPA